jgi:serine/threonine protein kinase
MFQPSAIEETAQTLDGSVIGTPLFMAPEQARGENDKIDARTDIYALGIVVYILLVRRHPHNVNEKSRWETVRAIADGHPRRPSELRPGFDPELEQILMTALANEQRSRYQTAAEFGAALRRFIEVRLGPKKQAPQ